MIPGLSTRIAPGEIPVVRLHYTADPAKRPGTPAGDARLAELAAGIPGGRGSPRWRKEMEIEYDALAGERVLPDWELWRAAGRIVIPPFDPVGYRLFASYDHGWRRPACFLVHGINGDGDLVTLWEFRASKVPVSAIQRVIHGEPGRAPDGRFFLGCPYAVPGEPLPYGWLRADPSIWAEDQPLTDQPNKSIAWLFRQPPRPVHFVPAERGGDNTILEWLLGHFWADPERPRYRITTDCPGLIAELGQLRHPDLSPAQLTRRDDPEGIVDKDCDAWDAVKYFLQRFPPTPVAPRAPAPPGTFGWWREQAKRSTAGRPAGTYRRALVG